MPKQKMTEGPVKTKAAGIPKKEIVHDRQVPGPAPLPPKAKIDVRHVILVLSGKGGVGKSTVSVNLAYALASAGKQVGLLDLDIHGPNIPKMLGIEDHKLGVMGNAIEPVRITGNLSVISMAFLLPDTSTPIIWRGPMIMKTVQQFVQNVKWGELDLLLVDLPPGTGDAQLSLAQTLPLDGAVLVTTPQAAATNIARKGGLMFQKVNVPLLGVAENMSYFVDPAGNRHALFGSGGGVVTAERLGTSLLGQVPLIPEIRAGGDQGTPVVVSAPTSAAGAVFREIAETLMTRLNAPTARS